MARLNAVLFGCAATTALMMEAPASAQASAPAQVARASAEDIEIIVTAQKREERLRDVPISITAISAEKLESPGVQSVADALRAVPGITAYENGQGGMMKFAVRGVTSNSSLFNSGTVVGFYQDEIPFAFVRFPVTPDTSAYDLERVEVLRGPQGTLYGAGSLNGVVRVLTKDADLTTFGGRARATASTTKDGDASYRADAAINIPLIPERLAVRAVAGYADQGGWIDLPAAGQKDVNDGKQKYVRLKVNAKPHENLDVEFLTYIFRNKRGMSPTSLEDRTAPFGFPQLVKSDFDAYSLTLNYDFSAFSVLSATSYMKFRGFGILDESPDILSTALSATMKSQEIRINSNREGAWRWSVGGIYRDAKDRRLQDFLLNIGLPEPEDNRFTSKSYAVFGELTRLLLGDRMEVTAGVRYFHDKTSSEELTTGTPTIAPFGKRTDEFEAITPRFVLKYKPSDYATFYGSYSQGFRSGFAQIGQVLRVTQGFAPGVKPDRLHNFEIGTKGVIAEGRVSYDLAGYYIKWEDSIQVIGNSVTFPSGIVTIYNAATNSEAITGFGFDAAATVELADGLAVGGSFSWNDLGFKDDVRANGTLVFPKGSRPPDSSKLTAGANIDYVKPLKSGFSAGFHGTVDYSSKLIVAGPLGTPIQSGDSLLRVGARATLESDKGWSLSVFGENITDEKGAIRPTVITGAGTSDRLRPRTFGIQFETTF